MKDWDERTSEFLTSLEALALVEDAHLLTARFGGWPTFEDAEVQSMTFIRGSHRVVAPGRWADVVAPSLTVMFYVLDTLYGDTDPRRNWSDVIIRFEDIYQIELDGFNHQNPIVGLSLASSYADALKKHLLFVNWGGTGIHHEVSFLCASAKIISVVERDAV